MKACVIEVHAMLSVLSVEGVETKIREVPGVEHATVNFAVGNTTARYDKTRIELADIKSSVRQSGSMSNGSTTASTGANHGSHAATGASLASLSMGAPESAPAGGGVPETATALAPATLSRRFKTVEEAR